jgi:hypothetical protein
MNSSTPQGSRLTQDLPTTPSQGTPGPWGRGAYHPSIPGPYDGGTSPYGDD